MKPQPSNRIGQVGEAFRPPATVLPAWLPARKQNRLALEVYREPGAFFVTITTHDRQAWFERDDITRHCIGQLRASCETEDFALMAFCFMPDHLHFLVTSEGRTDLLRLVKGFKQHTGWWLRNGYEAGGLKASPTSTRERPTLWQKSFYDHILRQEEDLSQVAAYILENPVTEGLAASAGEYPYAWSTAESPELART